MSAAKEFQRLPHRTLVQLANSFIAVFGTDNMRRLATVLVAAADRKDGVN